MFDIFLEPPVKSRIKSYSNSEMIQSSSYDEYVSSNSKRLRKKVFAFSDIAEKYDQDLGKNKKTLLSLLYLAGGKVKRLSRLQLAMFALKEFNLHTYKFKDTCSWGPADSQFRDDLNYFCGYILYDVYVSDDGHQHGIYELTNGGQMFAQTFIEEIKNSNPSGYKKLKEVASILRKPEERASTKTLYVQFVKQ